MSLRGGLNTEAYPMIIRTLTAFERDAVRNFYLALPRWPLQIDSTAIPQNSGRAHGVARYSKLRQGNHMHANAVLESTITCPRCGHRKTERMPSDACQWFYECEACHAVLKPKPGDCCVYCSYGTVKCPPMQLAGGDCCA
ncbi:MAG TPA: GDCCVxC domain-containing (seleno)protein [Terriglobales bacterium]